MTHAAPSVERPLTGDHAGGINALSMAGPAYLVLILSSCLVPENGLVYGCRVEIKGESRCKSPHPTFGNQLQFQEQPFGHRPLLP